MVEETRQQRRARERREGAPRPPASYSAREVVRIAIGSGGTGLVIGLIGGSFSASGIVSMMVAVIMLIFAWVVGAVAITVSEPVWGLPSSYRLGASLFTIFALGFVLGGIGWFQYQHMPVPDRGTASLTLNETTLRKLPGQNVSHVDIAVKNVGNAIALNDVTGAAGTVSNAVLSKDQINSSMGKVRDLVLKTEKQGPNHAQLAPSCDLVLAIEQYDAVLIDTSNRRLQYRVPLKMPKQIEDFLCN
jgi:hypothetical protein